jgi:hypothetical protein
VIDYDELYLQLLTRDCPAAGMVAPEQTTVTVDLFPAVIFSATLSGQQSNGPGLWTSTLTANVVGPPGPAWAVFSQLYDAVRTWPPSGGNRGRIDGLGAVERVSDQLFERTPSAGGNAGGKGTQQYTGTWSVLLRTIELEGGPHAGT